jgi:hypothetical protein
MIFMVEESRPKFHGKLVRKHGIRIAWKKGNYNKRQGICLVCGQRADKCTCEIKITDNQVRF